MKNLKGYAKDYLVRKRRKTDAESDITRYRGNDADKGTLAQYLLPLITRIVTQRYMLM